MKLLHKGFCQEKQLSKTLVLASFWSGVELVELVYVWAGNAFSSHVEVLKLFDWFQADKAEAREEAPAIPSAAVPGTEAAQALLEAPCRISFGNHDIL